MPRLISGSTRSRVKLLATYHAVQARNKLRRFEWQLLTPQDMSDRVLAQALMWRSRRPFAGYTANSGVARIDAAIERESSEAQVSYLARFGEDCLIEPRYGYAIAKPFRLIELSMPYTELSRNPEKSHLIGFPSLGSVVLARSGHANTLREERVISLRFHWENNYFHFLNDVLPRLRLVDDYGVPKDVPVIVGEKLARQPYFLSSFPNGTIAGREIIVQGKHTFIEADEVIFGRPFSLCRDELSYVADLMGAQARPSGSERLFLTRARCRGRYIENFDELQPILARFGLHVVDADGLSVAEQVQLFSSAQLVVGIHGAGLGNLIFRRGAPCTLIEIFPPEEDAIWFPWLADQLGFAYRALSGYRSGRVVHRFQPFRVDPTELERALIWATRLDVVRS